MKRSFSEERFDIQEAKMPKSDGERCVRQVKSTGDLSQIKVLPRPAHIILERREDNWYALAGRYYGRPIEFDEAAREDVNNLDGQDESDIPTEYQHKKFRKAMLHIGEQKPGDDVYYHKKFRRAQRFNVRPQEYCHKKFRRAQRFSVRQQEYYHKKFRRAERQKQSIEHRT